MVDNQILHRFFVNSRLGEIRADECVVFSDGRRSEGCSRDEFHTYVSRKSPSVCVGRLFLLAIGIGEGLF